MRQVGKTLALMTALCLVFSACSRGVTADDRAGEIQEEYSAGNDLTLTGNVTADYGEKIYEFRLKYTGNHTDCRVEILSPEELAGIAARLDQDGRTLEYDGCELSIGSVAGDGLSPMECIPFMLHEWGHGYISGAAAEKLGGAETVAVTFDIGENETLVTWFEAETNLPVRSEIFFDGDMVISCEFENIIT